MPLCDSLLTVSPKGLRCYDKGDLLRLNRSRCTSSLFAFSLSHLHAHQVNVKLVAGLRKSIKSSVNLKELAPSVNRKRLIQKVTFLLLFVSTISNLPRLFTMNLSSSSTPTTSPSSRRRAAPTSSCLSVFKDLEKRHRARSLHGTIRRGVSRRVLCARIHSEPVPSTS